MAGRSEPLTLDNLHDVIGGVERGDSQWFYGGPQIGVRSDLSKDVPSLLQVLVPIDLAVRIAFIESFKAG